MLDISWVQCHLVVLQRLKQKIHELNSHALAAMFCYQFAHQLLQQRKTLQLQRMGAEESKGGNYGLMGATSVESNMNKQATAARPWSLLHMCSLEQWKNGHAGLWLCRVVAPSLFILFAGSINSYNLI